MSIQSVENKQLISREPVQENCAFLLLGQTLLEFYPFLDFKFCLLNFSNFPNNCQLIYDTGCAGVLVAQPMDTVKVSV